MNRLGCIVRDTPGVLDLRPGDLCWIGRDGYDPTLGPEALVQVFRADFQWMTAWAPQGFFLLKHKFLKSRQRGRGREFVLMINTRRMLNGLSNPYLSHPHLEGDAMLGTRPWRFESIGEVVYFARLNKTRLKPFTICVSLGTKLRHLFK